jgi:hypothetical protein
MSAAFLWTSRRISGELSDHVLGSIRRNKPPNTYSTLRAVIAAAMKHATAAAFSIWPAVPGIKGPSVYGETRRVRFAHLRPAFPQLLFRTSRLGERAIPT